MKKKIWVLLIFFTFGYIIKQFFDIQLSPSFANTFYTVSSIMFSIGMGVVCTFNYDRIKNTSLLKSTQKNINKVRNNYLFLFSTLTISFLALQLLPQTNSTEPHNFVFFFFDSFPFLWTLFSLYSLAYFITNLILIQSLNFEIAKKLAEE